MIIVDDDKAALAARDAALEAAAQAAQASTAAHSTSFPVNFSPPVITLNRPLTVQQTCIIVATNTKDYPVAIKTGTSTDRLSVTPNMRRIEPQASVTVCVSVSRSPGGPLELSNAEHVWIQISAMPGYENSAERFWKFLETAPETTIHTKRLPVTYQEAGVVDPSSSTRPQVTLNPETCIEFYQDNGKPTAYLLITNPNSRPIVSKIKVNNKTAYVVQPIAMNLDPRQTCLVTISQSPTGSPSPKDILLVLSAFVPRNLTYLDRTSIDDLLQAIPDLETNSQILKVKPLGSSSQAPPNGRHTPHPHPHPYPQQSYPNNNHPYLASQPSLHTAMSHLTANGNAPHWNRSTSSLGGYSSNGSSKGSESTERGGRDRIDSVPYNGNGHWSGGRSSGGSDRESDRDSQKSESGRSFMNKVIKPARSMVNLRPPLQVATQPVPPLPNGRALLE